MNVCACACMRYSVCVCVYVCVCVEGKTESIFMWISDVCLALHVLESLNMFVCLSLCKTDAN